jgi:hypothetical protein
MEKICLTVPRQLLNNKKLSGSHHLSPRGKDERFATLFGPGTLTRLLYSCNAREIMNPQFQIVANVESQSTSK